MSAYYNENDPKTADWLRELIRQKLITEGEVDDRSIRSVEPADLRGYTQCHFFAGIGGWAHALELAGWGDRPVWTGSCPCQPFSLAGNGAGLDDERHLWPAWFDLIRECQPPILFGEQVASPAGLGWLDLVCADLEGAGYACGAADLCAAGVGAPHIRQRLYFVAHALSAGRAEGRAVPGVGSATGGDEPHFVGDPIGQGLAGWTGQSRDDGQEQQATERAGGGPVGLAHAIGPGELRDGRSGGEGDAAGAPRRDAIADGGGSSGPWRCDWLPCRDGKARPVRPGTFPLAHGLPARVVRLRGYGNAIVPQVAAEFIKASLGWENNQ